MNSKYLFLIETLYMTINLVCHYICSFVLRRNFRADITFLQPLLRICLNNGHTNFLSLTQGCRKLLWNSSMISAGRPSGRLPLDFCENLKWEVFLILLTNFRMRDVTNICWQILKWVVLLIFLTSFKMRGVTNIFWQILKWRILETFVNKL
jgi:hypothetical protein